MTTHFHTILIALLICIVVSRVMWAYIEREGHFSEFWPWLRRREERRRTHWLRVALGEKCVLCKEGLQLHLLYELSLIPHPTPDLINSFNAAILRRDWGKLVASYELLPQDADGLSHWLMTCPRTNRGAVFRVISPARFDESDDIEPISQIGRDDVSEIMLLVRRPPTLL